MKDLRKVFFSLLIIISSCSKREGPNYADKDLPLISLKISGVWVNSRDKNDTVLLYFDKSSEKDQEYFGLLSYHFTFNELGFKIVQLHDPTMKLFKKGNKAVIRFIPNFGKEKEKQITLINDRYLRFNDGSEFLKIQSFRRN